MVPPGSDRHRTGTVTQDRIRIGPEQSYLPAGNRLITSVNKFFPAVSQGTRMTTGDGYLPSGGRRE